jgi:hypothetical protein
MSNKILPVEAIRERDVDLILLEELIVDDGFGEWLIKTLDFPKLTNNIGAWKSISDFGFGETDILFSYTSNNKNIYVLIENKLDAEFQQKQNERYLQRAKKYVENGKCDEAYIILIAPKLYCENQKKFEKYITYEQIIERLTRIGNKRSLFKSELLKIATEKQRRGYIPVNYPPVQKFWYALWKFQKEYYPVFIMKEPIIKPRNSTWPKMFDKNLKGVSFYYKLDSGY